MDADRTMAGLHLCRELRTWGRAIRVEIVDHFVGGVLAPATIAEALQPNPLVLFGLSRWVETSGRFHFLDNGRK